MPAFPTAKLALLLRLLETEKRFCGIFICGATRLDVFWEGVNINRKAINQLEDRAAEDLLRQQRG